MNVDFNTFPTSRVSIYLPGDWMLLLASICSYLSRLIEMLVNVSMSWLYMQFVVCHIGFVRPLVRKCWIFTVRYGQTLFSLKLIMRVNAAVAFSNLRFRSCINHRNWPWEHAHGYTYSSLSMLCTEASTSRTNIVESRGFTCGPCCVRIAEQSHPLFALLDFQ